MFGFVRPAMDKLEETDKDIFNGYYCGVCKSIAKRYTPLARMALSFDCTFLALFLSAVNANEPHLTDFRCVLRKRKQIVNDAVDYSADINVLLTYYKMVDDVNDDGSLKAKVGKSVFKNPYNKAKAAHPNIDKVICSNLDYLYSLERDKCDNPDFVADAFGRLLEGIAGNGCHMDRRAMNVCYNLGKYIYLIDAFVDYEKDIKNKSYNVFYEKYGEVEDLKDKVSFLFECTLSQMVMEYQGMDISVNKNIIDNILYLGIIQPLLADTKENK